MINFRYRKGFNTVPREAERLKGGEYRTLSIVIRLWVQHAEKKGKKYWLEMSLDQLQKELNIGKITLANHLDTLVNEGFLLRKKGRYNSEKGKKEINRYMFNPIYWEEKQPKPKAYRDFDTGCEVICEGYSSAKYQLLK